MNDGYSVMERQRDEARAELAKLREEKEALYRESNKTFSENVRLREALRVWQEWYAGLPDLQGRYPVPAAAIDKTYDALKETRNHHDNGPGPEWERGPNMKDVG